MGFQTEIPLWLDTLRRSVAGQPVTFGLPFPRGRLTDPGELELHDAEGRPLLTQTRSLLHWPDGSIQWLLLDAIAGPLPEGRSSWTLAANPGSRSPSTSSLRVAESSEAWVINTSAATFHLSRTQTPLLTRAVIDGRDLLDASATRLTLADANGKAITPRVEHASLEQGPVRLTVRYQGTFPGTAPCRFVARLCFFAGTGLVRLRLTVHNPRRAQHPGGQWDLGDPNSFFFRDLSLNIKLRDDGEPHLSWTPEPGHAVRALTQPGLEIFQASSGGDNWQSRNHVNRDGRVPCPFRGYRVRAAGEESTGLRANPVVTLQGSAGCVTAALPEFWQQFPKAIAVHGRSLRLGLFPEQWGDLFELQGGEQKTNTVWLHFGAAAPAEDTPLDWVHQPACVHASPEWYAGSGAFPFLTPGPTEERLETLLRVAIEGGQSFAARREIIDEYGWRNYGDLFADHEEAYYDGPKPTISHYNNQYDCIFGLLLQFFRTGEPCWYALADPLARHVIDIDIYHTDQDRAAYNGGLFWHTNHYLDAVTCSHRSYSRANHGKLGSYGGGPSNEHNYTTGLLHYYFLTGAELARDAVLSLADWVVNMDDGRETPFGVFDDGPTGGASSTCQREYHGPGRGCGNSVNALLDAWQLTGRQHYLDKTESLIRRCVHPADDVEARNLLNIELRWSYTVFFLTLDKYLRLKAEYGAIDEAYAYAQASLCTYARWMLEHEQPYFDRPEKMEYPTETWAAQELRKASVLRAAAGHVDEPLRGRMQRRGEEFAERAWRDLLSFASRAVTRSLAILMIEGLRDAWLRGGRIFLAPRPAQSYDFGRPQAFIPQKARVKNQLRSPGGLARAVLRLADVQKWPRILKNLRRR
jgi:hypothetical protein